MVQKNTVHSSREGTTVGYDTAGHIVSTFRKQKEMNVPARLIFSFRFSPGPQPIEWHVHTGMVGFPQLHLSGKALRHAQRCVSLVIPNPIKMTIKIITRT